MLKILTSLLFVCNVAALGQSALLFSKGRYRNAYYHSGDVISLKVKDNNEKITGRINGFEDSLIIFKEFRINVNEVTHFYADDKTKVWFALSYKWQYLLPARQVLSIWSPI